MPPNQEPFEKEVAPNKPVTEEERKAIARFYPDGKPLKVTQPQSAKILELAHERQQPE